MARKPLLTEAEIRSFMKLANLAPIGDVKLQEMGYGHEETVAEEEEELEMDAELGDVEEEPPAAPMDAPADDMDAELDADLDVDMDADVGGGDTEEQFMDLVQQLADLVGVEVDMDDGAEAAGDELEMGDDVDSLEGGDDLGDDAALDDEMPPMPDEDEDEDPPGMKMYESEEDIVNEVARRVAARLQAEDSKQKLAEELTEKIFNRLTNNG